MGECLEWGVGAQKGKAGHPCREGGSDRDGRLVTDGTERLVNVLRTMETTLTVSHCNRRALQNKKERKLE